MPGRRNRFRLEREAALSMLRFGRWIFLSTALTFVASEGDRLLMGKLLTMEELGVYNIAFFLAVAVPMALASLSVSARLYVNLYLNTTMRSVAWPIHLPCFAVMFGTIFRLNQISDPCI